MEEAWLKASANGTLPANARQIMYAARAYIQEMTDKPLNDKYFTQVLLPDYIAENGVDWDVVFDDCGHFEEPHTDTAIGVGTVLREYLARRHHPVLTQATLAPSWPAPQMLSNLWSSVSRGIGRDSLGPASILQPPGSWRLAGNREGIKISVGNMRGLMEREVK